MALKQCHECNGTVSTEAESCPHCGAPSRKPAGVVRPTKDRILYHLTTAVLVIGWPLFIILMYIQSTHNPQGIFH
jgi:hypothetical protein